MRLPCRFGAAVASLILLAACGGGGSPESQIELPPAASTTAPAPGASIAGSSGAPASPVVGGPTTTAAPSQWTPASANLAGMSSGCGNVGLASLIAQDRVVASVAGTGLFAQPSSSDQWTALGTAGDKIANRMSALLVDPQQPNTFW